MPRIASSIQNAKHCGQELATKLPSQDSSYDNLRKSVNQRTDPDENCDEFLVIQHDAINARCAAGTATKLTYIPYQECVNP
jgi:hypothetical protein